MAQSSSSSAIAARRPSRQPGRRLAAPIRRAYSHSPECFLALHDEIAEEFCKRVNAAYGGPQNWRDRIWAAIDFLREDPVRARFFAVEVNGAGRPVQARRDRIMGTFAELLDAGRAELEDPGSASCVTAEIVAGAIYQTIQQKIRAGCIDRGEEFLPELVYVATMPYLGARAAEDESRSLGTAAVFSRYARLE